jgi:hypothetical protein
MTNQGTMLGDDLTVQRIKDNVNQANSLVESQRGFLRKLFPGNIERIIRDSQLRQAQTVLEFREIALDLAKQAHLQSIREILNQYLSDGKARLRKDRAVFFTAQARELEKEINEMVYQLNLQMEIAYEQLNRIKIPTMRELEEKRIENSIFAYMEAIETLRTDFYNILNENVEL